VKQRNNIKNLNKKLTTVIKKNTCPNIEVETGIQLKKSAKWE